MEEKLRRWSEEKIEKALERVQTRIVVFEITSDDTQGHVRSPPDSAPKPGKSRRPRVWCHRFSDCLFIFYGRSINSEYSANIRSRSGLNMINREDAK